MSDEDFEETHEYIWEAPNKIPNAICLSRETREFSVTSKNNDITLKWEIGFKCIDEDWYKPYIKLLNRSGDCLLYPLTWKLQWRSHYGSRWMPATEYKIEAINPISDNEVITFPSYKIGFLVPDSQVQVMPGFAYKSELLVRIKSILAKAVAQFKAASTANHQRSMAELLSDSDSADLKILCRDGVELCAHTLILKYCQSPVIVSMLISDMSERNTGVLNLEDVSSSTMKLLLHYLYTGELQDEWRQSKNIVEFTYAAGKYQLEDILNLLNESLGTFDHGESTVPLLSLAAKLGFKKAEQRLLMEVKKTLGEADSCDNLFKIFQNVGFNENS